jgi:Ca2+-transporting ATPase
MQWWNKNSEAVIAELNSNSDVGLASDQVKILQQQYGQNVLVEKAGVSPWKILIQQFAGLLIWVLIGAAAISGILGEWVDSIAIIAIVIVNALIGFFQEFRAEKALAALKKLSAPSAKVFRDGIKQVINANDLVPGDIVEVEAGDNIPADCRIIRAFNLSSQEASLTGESLPVEKTAHEIKGDVALGDRKNMLYLGTHLVAGKGLAVITSIGMSTELGKIAAMMQSVEDNNTPLQERLQKLGQGLVYICIGIVIIIFGLGIWRGIPALEMFMTAVSLAVAAIPEGLPAIVTIALALGVQRMVKRNVLIRKLTAIETLGSASVICTDKTGTLTQNKMHVRDLWGDEKSLLQTSVLCNGAEVHEDKSVGDPLEIALLEFGLKKQVFKKEQENLFSLVQELPFDSGRKLMSTVRKSKNGLVAFCKGAPEVVLNCCTHYRENNQDHPMTEEKRKEILQINENYARQAYRVLGFASKSVKDYQVDLAEPNFTITQIESGLVFEGLIAMIDPPREEVKAAIAACKSAGIEVYMITGDHLITAQAIAKEIGIPADHVFARVTAADKLRIVKDLRAQGKVVAMTGDGVNDAPALKEADIGVAMGITGTDVTKEASDMVITDDNFASIEAAIEEGRGIYENIKKSVYFLLSCNTGEIMVMFLASLFGLPLPLFAIQILFVNLVTDGLPALALGIDPTEKGIMNKPPRPKNEAILTRSFLINTFVIGSFIALITLGAFVWELYFDSKDVEAARTMAFFVLATSQLVHSYNCRSSEKSIFKLGIFSNPQLIGATLLSLIMLLMVSEIGVLQQIFKVVGLTWKEWIVAILLSLSPLLLVEILKVIYNHGNKKNNL